MKIIPMYPNGSSSISVSLNNITINIESKYNYTAGVWCVDILDLSGNMIQAGLMLIPGTDLLETYQQTKKNIGSIVPVEQFAGSYSDPDLLGSELLLLWFEPGEPIKVPE